MNVMSDEFFLILDVPEYDEPSHKLVQVSTPLQQNQQMKIMTLYFMV